MRQAARPCIRLAGSASAIALGIMMALPAVAQQSDAAQADLPSRAEMWRIIQDQQQRIATLEKLLKEKALPTAEAARRSQQDLAPRIDALAARIEEQQARIEATGALLESQAGGGGHGGWWRRVKLGGYGSVRFEASDAKTRNTGFTFRRFVLALDAEPTDRLETYLELELERFTQIEVEKALAFAPGELEIEQAIEATNGSEISVEQAWARYRLTDALALDFGALLVPVGRFNINHDDNQWILPRRSLVDRGVPVLPAKAAWAELGAGVSGILDLGEAGRLDYRLYAVNGVALDFELEEVLKAASEDEGVELESKFEASFGPQRGPFDGNMNDNLSITGRLAWHPAPAHEIAVAGYVGNYVPDALGKGRTLWSLSLDGLSRFGGLELEYEAVTTHFSGVADVAAEFAARALAKERAIEGPVESGAFAKHEVEFTLSKNVMAKQKTGYWVELRYPIALTTGKDNLFTKGFTNPRLVPTLRFEQVFFDDQLTGISFDAAAVTALSTRDARIGRATAGLGFVPRPGWVFQIAGEYTWTNQPTLAGLTNFLDAGGRDDSFALLLGVAFGF